MSAMIAAHPYRDLMAEAERERQIIEGPESRALQERMFEAVLAYGDFLESQNLVWDDVVDPPRLKAQSLVVTLDFGQRGSVDITLKDGALDRVYGKGRNPDPFEAGPPDIPHRPRH
jgi:hypothetical protein